MIVDDGNVEEYLRKHGWQHATNKLKIDVFWSDKSVDAALHVYKNEKYGAEYYLIEPQDVPEIDFDRVSSPHVKLYEMDYTDLPFLFAVDERDELVKNDYILLSDETKDKVKKILETGKSIYSIPWTPLDRVIENEDREVELYFGATPINENIDRETFRRMVSALLDDISFRKFLLNKYVTIIDTSSEKETHKVMKEKDAIKLLEEMAYQ